MALPTPKRIKGQMILAWMMIVICGMGGCGCLMGLDPKTSSGLPLLLWGLGFFGGCLWYVVLRCSRWWAVG